MAAEGVGILLYSVDTIFGMVRAITEAAKMVRRNKEECENIARCVATVSAVLKGLHESSASAMAVDPAMAGALQELGTSLQRALELVGECQEKRLVRSLLGARDMASELRGVHDDINRKVTLASFAANVQTAIAMNNNMRHAPHHPPSPLWTPRVAPSPPPVLAPQPTPPWPVAPWQANQWPSSSQVAAPCQKPPSMAEFCCPSNWHG